MPKWLLLIDCQDWRKLSTHHFFTCVLPTVDPGAVRIGIILPDHHYSSRAVSDLIRKYFQNTQHDILWIARNNSLEMAISPPVSSDDSVLLISSSVQLIAQAEMLKYQTIKIPCFLGELSRTHEKRFRSLVATRVAQLPSEQKLLVEINLDIDETLLFFALSQKKNKLILNDRVLTCLQSFLTQYYTDPRVQLEMRVVTSRNTQEATALGGLSVQCVLQALYEKMKNDAYATLFDPKTLPVFYTHQKLETLQESYTRAQKNHQSIHVLLDDNPRWTDCFDSNTALPAALSYIAVHTFSQDADCNHLIFPCDESWLQRWASDLKSSLVAVTEKKLTIASSATAVRRLTTPKELTANTVCVSGAPIRNSSAGAPVAPIATQNEQPRVAVVGVFSTSSRLSTAYDRKHAAKQEPQHNCPSPCIIC